MENSVYWLLCLKLDTKSFLKAHWFHLKNAEMQAHTCLCGIPIFRIVRDEYKQTAILKASCHLIQRITR